MAKTWLNYVTFSRDYEWMKYSLDSFKKYATGFSGVTIVVPTWDVEKFLPYEKYSTNDCPVLIKNFLEYPSKGFVHHLAMKCYADVFSPEADFIIHLDPDCLFHEPVKPSDYIDGNRAVIVAEPYDVVEKYFPGRFHWRSVTEDALKFNCEYETMCCHPAIYTKSTYGELRSYIESVHLTPFMDFVLKQKNTFPQGFGEHNTLGSFAIKYLPEEYKIVDCGPERLARMDDLIKNSELKIGHPHQKLTQFWSYRGTREYMDKINEILK